jgi:hypothetical protein
LAALVSIADIQRVLAQQKTEAWVSASALNVMTNLGMPVSMKL